MAPASSPSADSHAQFHSTQWGLVLATAREADPAAAHDALSQLCLLYWAPLYAFARRKGNAPADAKDAVQGFLVRLIENGSVGRADPGRGRFRTFLQMAFSRYLISEWTRATTQKRGGLQPVLALDAESVEALGLPELTTAATPERAFDELWARTVWERAVEALAAEARQRGKFTAFQALRPFLGQEGNAEAYAAMAASLGIQAPTVKTLVHRLRRELGEKLRREVEQTIEDPAELAAEIQHLRGILSEVIS